MPESPPRPRPPVLTVRAEPDPSLLAVLGPTFPLLYREGGSHADDHPAFARAASAIVHWQHKRVIIQDDVNALAIGPLAEEAFAPEGLQPLLLPRGAGGRRRHEDAIGNKRQKLDLEAAVVLPDGRLLVLGSGSLRARERFVLIGADGSCQVRDASELYAKLRSQPAFAGSELNLEGVLVRSNALELFQRGNGLATGELAPVSAVGTLPLDRFLSWLDHGGPVPELTRIVQVDLGQLGGVRLSFTDAALARDGSVAFLASAEDSRDAIQDGQVLGSRFGILDERGVRLVEIVDACGAPCMLKLEGLHAHPCDAACFDVVADMDHPEQPAVGGVLEVVPR
jgi:hypothetical protein